MKKKVFLLLILAFTVGVLTSFFVWWRSNSQPVSENERVVSFVIPKGRSASQIASMLKEKKLIRSSLAFKFYVQLTGVADKIQAGEFSLSPSMSLQEILDGLFKGPVELWVTVPEGLRREEVVEKFTRSLEMDSQRSSEFKEEFLTASAGMEGYLFPDTYLFPRDAEAQQVVARMKQVFDESITEEMRQRIGSGKYSLDQIVTMASIIERETITDKERPIVAGILYKRLETEGWLLQADATVQYAIGSIRCKERVDCEWWQVPTLEDLDINSPYNSYKFSDLPPTPIASPGISSLKAAVFPQDSPYWFYIHDPDGKIHYGKTISEHNINVRKYLGK